MREVPEWFWHELVRPVDTTVENWRGPFFRACRKAAAEHGYKKKRFAKELLPLVCRRADEIDRILAGKTRKASVDRQVAYFRRIKTNYGLSKDQFLLLLTDQESACAVCEHPLVLFGEDSPVVDHCHETGKVRGLVCRACNNRLPRQLSEDWHAAADRYLSRSRARS